MSKVSIIIPAYNAEKYIEDCLNTIINQSLSDIEIIVINDGSIDNTKAIVEDFQNKDSRILLIDQNNQGVSVARNNGIKKATGEFIGFVDADDYIESDMYEVLYNSAKVQNADIVVSNFHQSPNNHDLSYQIEKDKYYNKEEINNDLMLHFLKDASLNSACNKIYRKTVLSNFTIFFPTTIKNGEDRDFNILAFYHSNSVYLTKYAGYHYRYIQGSASQNPFEKDYFRVSLDLYHCDNRFFFNIDDKEYNNLRDQLLIKDVSALINIYFSNKIISLKKSFSYVKKMVNNNDVQKALKNNNLLKNKSRFERFIINKIKNKSIFILWLATKYSNFRNKK